MGSLETRFPNTLGIFLILGLGRSMGVCGLQATGLRFRPVIPSRGDRDGERVSGPSQNHWWVEPTNRAARFFGHE